MSLPCREQILAAVETALSGITGITDLTVDRDRVDMPADDELPILTIYEGAEQPADDFTGERGYVLGIDIEGQIAGATRVEAVQNGATLRAKVDQAMLADLLGGLARDVRVAEEEAPPRLDLAAVPHAYGFVRSYAIEFATREDDPFTFA